MEAFPAPDPFNGETVLEELAAAGVDVNGLPQIVDGKLLLDVDAGARDAVKAVLARHGGGPSPRAVNGPAIRQAVADHLATLRTIRDSSGNLSPAQASNAIRALARGQVHIIRLLLEDLDDVD